MGQCPAAIGAVLIAPPQGSLSAMVTWELYKHQHNLLPHSWAGSVPPFSLPFTVRELELSGFGPTVSC